jgi:N-acetylmuramoyl-L-alanine amidase
MAKRHVVHQGECLSRIARRYGFSDYKKLYDHPDNAELKRKRPNPNVIYPGDIVAIPDLEDKTESVGTGQKHRFQVTQLKKELRIAFKDARMYPLSGVSYVLRTANEILEGRTNAAGLLKDRVRTDSMQASVVIDGRTINLRLGYLNPSERVGELDVSGVQSRLKGLGYYLRDTDGVLSQACRTSLAIFQAENNLTVDGKPTSATIGKLEELFGC